MYMADPALLPYISTGYILVFAWSHRAILTSFTDDEHLGE